MTKVRVRSKGDTKRFYSRSRPFDAPETFAKMDIDKWTESTGSFVSEKQDAATPPISDSPFRFSDLPAELRLQVYHELMPHGVELSPYGTSRMAWQSDGNVYDRFLGTHSKRYTGEYASENRHFPRTYTNIFLVSKSINKEARSVLYGGNTFRFSINASNNTLNPSKPCDIFGDFRQPLRMHLLRDMRSIKVDMFVSEKTHWAVKRHRSRLSYFIRVLKQHSDDEAQKSLLENLEVSYGMTPKVEEELQSAYYHRAFSVYYLISWTAEQKRMFMFSLEELVAFDGIKNVKVSGDGVPEWFRRCLEICISCKAGEGMAAEKGRMVKPSVLEYPEVLVKKTIPRDLGLKRRYKMVMRTTKQWMDPLYNWKEFAESNGIEIPAEEMQEVWSH